MRKGFSGESSLLVRSVTFGAIGIAALSGCSSTSNNKTTLTTSVTASASTPNSTPTASPGTVETKCTAESPDKWQGFPANFDPNRVAQRLGVPAVEVVTKGRFGGAVCDQSVQLARIGTPDSPVVSVDGIGSPCVVIGTKEDPRTVTQTPNILAICISNIGPSTLPTT